MLSGPFRGRYFKMLSIVTDDWARAAITTTPFVYHTLATAPAISTEQTGHWLGWLLVGHSRAMLGILDRRRGFLSLCQIAIRYCLLALGSDCGRGAGPAGRAWGNPSILIVRGLDTHAMTHVAHCGQMWPLAWGGQSGLTSLRQLC